MQTLQDKSVAILAGGTGGHIYPALAIATELQARGATIVWLGTNYGLEKKIVPKAGIDLRFLSIRGLRGKKWLEKIIFPLRLLLALLQAIVIFRTIRPDVVLGMGGYVAAPGGLAAKILRIPLVLHEQNSVAGKTNLILAHIATKVLQAFPGSFPAKIDAKLTGNPLRRDILQVCKQLDTKTTTSIRLLVLGGSQGSMMFNSVMPGVIKRLQGRCIQVKHISGVRYFAATKQAYAGLDNVQVLSFLDDIASAYTWADLVICRSGALTVTELAAVGLPSILVPFKHAVDDHQTKNADYLVAKKAALSVTENDFTEQKIWQLLSKFLDSPAELKEMARLAFDPKVANATNMVLSACIEVIN